MKHGLDMYCFRACVVRYSLVSGNLVAEMLFPDGRQSQNKL